MITPILLEDYRIESEGEEWEEEEKVLQVILG